MFVPVSPSNSESTRDGSRLPNTAQSKLAGLKHYAPRFRVRIMSSDRRLKRFDRDKDPLRRIFREAVERSGVMRRFTLHDIQRAAATHLHLDAMPLKRLRRAFLGTIRSRWLDRIYSKTRPRLTGRKARSTCSVGSINSPAPAPHNY